MGLRSSKRYRKWMQAYELSFDFRVPYQVLFDAAILMEAARCSMNLQALLEKTLQGPVKPMITQCCIRHLYKLEVEQGKKADKERLIEVAKKAERRRCGHHELEEPLSALECIQSVVDPKGSGTNKHRYVVASQELEVREAMRKIAGVPLIYINRSVMIMEPPSAKTERYRESEEVGKRKAGLRGRTTLAAGEKRKREDEVTGDLANSHLTMDAPAHKRKKMKGPKGPNPLSVKKAKKAAGPADRTEDKRRAEQKPTVLDSTTTLEASAEPAKANGSEHAPKKRKRKRKPQNDLADVDTVAGDHEASD